MSEIMGCNDLWCGLSMHKCMKITDFYVGTSSGHCILVKNHHLCFKKVPMDSTSMPSLKS